MSVPRHSARPSVCAVLLAAHDAIEQAVRDQDPSPWLVVDPDLAAGVAQARARQADWMWVLDGSAVPEPGALATLLSAGTTTLSALQPAVLASKVVSGNGLPAPGLLPWLLRSHIEVGMFAFEREAVPIRATPGSSILVARSAASGVAPPHGRAPPRLAVLGWTARILRSGTGFVVPASAARAVAAELSPSGPGHEGAADLGDRLALLRAKAWDPKERVRLGAEILGRAARVTRSGQATAVELWHEARRGLSTEV